MIYFIYVNRISNGNEVLCKCFGNIGFYNIKINFILYFEYIFYFFIVKENIFIIWKF